MLNRWGVYCIPCKCVLGYIDQNKRALKYSGKEYIRCVFKEEVSRSLISEHS